MKKFVLDTSALLAYIENEDGVNELESLFEQAVEDEIELLISVISCVEVFYISCREQGEKIAHERLMLIKNLPLQQETVQVDQVEIIGRIKAANKLSFADSCIAGLAQINQAILVHKDPEYEQLADQIEQLKLPYKTEIHSK